MNNSNIPYFITGLVVLAAAYGGWKVYQVEQHRVERARAAGGISGVSLPLLEGFELTERSGKTFRSADMEGKVWVTTFFFSTCDGSCTRLNANIKRMTTLEGIEDVTWVSITVDPETDTLETLNSYADNLRADPDRWLFCRGDLSYVKRLAEDVLTVGGVQYRGHNDYAVVVDKQGNVRGMFNAVSTRESDRMVALLEELVQEPAAATSQEAEHGSDGEPDKIAPPDDGDESNVSDRNVTERASAAT